MLAVITAYTESFVALDYALCNYDITALMFAQDGWLYFIDGRHTKTEVFLPHFCYFRAQHIGMDKHKDTKTQLLYELGTFALKSASCIVYSAVAMEWQAR